MSRAIGLPFPTFIFLLLISAFIGFYAPRDAVAQTTPPPFEPGAVACIEDAASTIYISDTSPLSNFCKGNPAPAANSDIRTRFCIGWDNQCTTKDSAVNDSNFGAVVGFTPQGFTLPKGDTVPIGALAGRLTSQATLGLLNGPCSTTIGVSFTMMNASIDVADIIKPRPPGEADVFTPLAVDASPKNGIPDGADHYPSFLSALFDPDFDTYGPDNLPFTGDDENGSQPPIQPRARLFGITRIQNTWISLNFVYFEPGQTLRSPRGPVTLNPDLGYPSVTILVDPTAPPAQSPITSFCAPLFSSTVTFGLTRDNPCTPSTPSGQANCPDQTPEQNRGYPMMPCEVKNAVDEDADGKVNDGCPQEGTTAESGAECDNATSDDLEDSVVNDGCPVVGAVSEGGFIPGNCAGTNEASCVNRQNPSGAGAAEFVTFVASQRDADGDGIENSLDPCDLIPNPDWNPRALDANSTDNKGDDDNDGLPEECDTGGSGPDLPSPQSPQTCPLGATGQDDDQDCFANRTDNCPLKPNDPPVDNTDLNSAGQRTGDGIGNACDTDTTPNGAYAALCVVLPVTIGAGASTAPLPPQFIQGETCAEAAGAGSDSDGDGVADSADQCASTAAGAAVDASGCSKAQVDSDGDGVCNFGKTSTLCTGTDRCEGTPAGATVDTFGCTPEQAVLDDDKDGVKNVDDACPGTPTGESVDAKGCSASQLTGSGTDGGPGTGVGSLAPAVSSIPAWAAIASGLGGAGLLGSLGAFVSRVFRRRRE